MRSFGLLSLACLLWLWAALDGAEARKRKPVDQIKNGELIAYPGEFPFHVRIDVFDAKYQRRLYRCGGAILDEIHVLTTSHCMYDGRPWSNDTLIDPGRIFLRYGCGDYSRCDDDEYYFQVKKVISFHRPKNSKLYKDFPEHAGLAILQTYFVIRFTKGLKMVHIDCEKLGSDCPRETPKELTLVGFGGTEPGQPATWLRKAQLKIPEPEFCDQHWPQRINKATFCAGDSNTAPCTDDVGAPLVKVLDKEFLLWGITNEHHFNCKHEAGALFTRVAVFKDWIKACKWSYDVACEADIRMNNSIHPIVRRDKPEWPHDFI